MTMPFLAVIYVSKTPPSHLIEHFYHISDEQYSCAYSPECYNDSESVFYNLYTTLDFYCPDDADEMYEFLYHNENGIEYEECPYHVDDEED